jgi:hypothetical protein
MKTVIFLAALFIGNVLSAQTIYSPLNSNVVPDGEKYTNGVWYTDEHEGSFCWFDNKADGEKFLKDLAKDLNIDLNGPFRKVGESKVYKSEVCENMQVKWVKTLYNEKMLLVRVYF